LAERLIDRATRALSAQVPGHSLAALRIAFGALMFGATIRFWAYGWIEELYVAPRFHFTYYGFSWVHPWPSPMLHAHFALLAVAALFVALGLFHRASSAAFFVLFLYVELLDSTTYLNHYYAISLVALLLCFVPAANVMSLDALRAKRAGTPLPETVPHAAILLLRAQLAVIYFFAGVAKLNEDWLLHAEPMTTWLAARTDMPLLGPLLAQPWAPLAMSWAGAVFDLTIPIWLSLRRTRPLAFVTVVLFHVITWRLFPIGMFPWVMIGLTPIFFPPDWPLTLRRSPRPAAPSTSPPLSHATLALMTLWLAVQCALPLRHLLYEGDVHFTEEGMRFSWQVMIVERGGTASFRTIDAEGVAREVDPSVDLTPLQRRMMSTQPDMILQYAHHLAEQRPGARVYADVFVATNGGPSRRLVDPAVDLAREEDGLFGYDWVLTEDDPRTWR
jgi:vitamin K-dependent gamma-carboxylase